MIPSRVDSTARNSDWDLTSSATGTVKRRPTSQSSTSPSKHDSDFPDDGASCKIDKSSTEASDLSQEISGGSSKGSADELLKGGRRKINNQKKRFFDLKLPESARKSFASKLKLPNRVSLTLSPRKTSSRNKLSLSQLEQQNNLFIRDGQSSDSSTEVNKQDEIMAESNPKQKQVPSKKSSLIPAFLGGSAKPANQIKIPSTSGSAKKASSTTVVEKLTKTGNKFKELYRDFPGDKAAGGSRRNPPPYRPPPTPSQDKQKRIQFTESNAKNYEEIEPFSEAVGEEIKSNDDKSNDDEDVDMMSKAEYSSNVFKNIPVRQKKGALSHMENYCVFEPTDFTNEKELLKKKLRMSGMTVGTSKHFQLNESEENIEDVTFEDQTDQTVYDISEMDEREKMLAHHNYYEIDPELLLEEGAVESLDQVPIECKPREKVGGKNRKSKIYSNTLSTSSESTSGSQTSNSSSTATSSDYPSLFNSVIETTHSSTVESTDDNDSNGYGKVKASSPTGDTINQLNANAVSNESVITVVTCGDSNASPTGATKKKSPQLNRIIRPASSSATRGISQKQSNKQQTSSLATKSKSSKINLPFNNKALQLDPMKSSHSLPHLQNATVQSRCRQQGTSNEFNVVIDTIHLRRQQNVRQGRPLSGHSDDRDSGFLSPATPPDSHNNPAHITPNVIIKETEQNTKTESTLLNQCDNIQQLIEVSNRCMNLCVTCELLWRNGTMNKYEITFRLEDFR